MAITPTFPPKPTLPLGRVVQVTLDASVAMGFSPGGTNQSGSFPGGTVLIGGMALRVDGQYVRIPQ